MPVGMALAAGMSDSPINIGTSAKTKNDAHLRLRIQKSPSALPMRYIASGPRFVQ